MAGSAGTVKFLEMETDSQGSGKLPSQIQAQAEIDRSREAPLTNITTSFTSGPLDLDFYFDTTSLPQELKIVPDPLNGSSLIGPSYLNTSGSRTGAAYVSSPLLPLHLRKISETQRNVVIAYSLFFLLGASGNLSVFLSVCRQLGKLKWRITILIVHLSVADLIVTFTVIPSEIFWRLALQWYGGNVLCKVCQFARAFGLYLSSMVLICISLDRFFAILHPLKMVNASRRVKTMLAIAWILAALFSVPQVRKYRYKFSKCHHMPSLG
jgi:gonadotropin-releasing hormone receptor